MVSIYDLLKDEKDKVAELSKLRLEAIDEKQKQENNEAHLWMNTPFKEKGLTNEKTRKAYVIQQMGLLYPSFYETKKASIANLEDEIKWIRETIDTMKHLGVTEIDFEKKEEAEGHTE